jgi:hypothetical protein
MKYAMYTHPCTMATHSSPSTPKPYFAIISTQKSSRMTPVL